jgi:hypothetical protein
MASFHGWQIWAKTWILSTRCYCSNRGISHSTTSETIRDSAYSLRIISRYSCSCRVSHKWFLICLARIWSTRVNWYHREQTWDTFRKQCDPSQENTASSVSSGKSCIVIPMPTRKCCYTLRWPTGVETTDSMRRYNVPMSFSSGVAPDIGCM